MNEVEFNVSNAELIVMRVIWSLGEARVDEIYAQIPQELEWSLATVKTLLGRLVKKRNAFYRKRRKKICLSSIDGRMYGYKFNGRWSDPKSL